MLARGVEELTEAQELLRASDTYAEANAAARRQLEGEPTLTMSG